MNEQRFDVLTRQAAMSRRRSLPVLGIAGAGLAALAVPGITSARKKKRRDPNKTCKQLAGKCKASWEAICEELNCIADARESLLACCEFFKTCNAGKYNLCVLGVLD